MAILFHFLRNCETVRWCGQVAGLFQDTTSNVQGLQFPYFLTSFCYFLLFFFLIATLVDMKRYLIMILICISLMGNDTEHFCVCFLAISVSLEECLFQSFALFSLGYLFFVVDFPVFSWIYSDQAFLLIIPQSYSYPGHQWLPTLSHPVVHLQSLFYCPHSGI